MFLYRIQWIYLINCATWFKICGNFDVEIAEFSSFFFLVAVSILYCKCSFHIRHKNATPHRLSSKWTVFYLKDFFPASSFSKQHFPLKAQLFFFHREETNIQSAFRRFSSNAIYSFNTSWLMDETTLNFQPFCLLHYSQAAGSMVELRHGHGDISKTPAEIQDVFLCAFWHAGMHLRLLVCLSGWREETKIDKMIIGLFYMEETGWALKVPTFKMG